jgi:hypothetical protein
MAITAKSKLIFDEREILLYLNFLSFVSAITHQREYISDYESKNDRQYTGQKRTKKQTMVDKALKTEN